MVQTDSDAPRAQDGAGRAANAGDAADAAAGTAADAARSRRFQQLALPHLDAAYNLARWLCGNASDADDIVQEAFMRAFRFFDTFRGDTARPWLLAIVRRTWYTEWRRRAASHETVEFDDTMDDSAFDGWSVGGADPQTLLIRDEDTKLVHEALALLPVEYREVLILRELEEMGYREIALVADVPIGTVMSRLARGRRKLAALLTAKSGAGAGAGVGVGACTDAGAGGADLGKAGSATVTPLRAAANGRPNHNPGQAGHAQETPDGL
ncbi:RNA polymerase sigma factor [Paraburkholderia sp. D15]|uniref:RNA polymerase sigma factor n=1 Tax=Paraburkholderia sp. D15 TaxID=2880218 RepID=UPI00247AECA1|nr:RNA polymerase sigma factor [Paraburkholderia sp. D15]WGS48308.1 RNA polymerase sigma factor [Paraburkholderia sp. D15]WKF56181.1 ECF RNA polymerase sigma factor SigR [Paraburkholderia busanensis]